MRAMQDRLVVGEPAGVTALTTMLASGVVGLETAKRICGLLGFTRDCQDNLREAPIVSSLADGVGVGDYWLTAESRLTASQSKMSSIRYVFYFVTMQGWQLDSQALQPIWDSILQIG